MVKLLKRKFISRNVYDLAIERINYAFDIYDHVAVAFSGGKDSTVCLNLALEVARERQEQLPLEVHFFDEEAIPYETEHYVRRVSQIEDVKLYWWCLPVTMINGCSRDDPYWWCFDPEVPDKWVRPIPPEALTELHGFKVWPKEDRLTVPNCNGLLFPPEKYGTVGHILGIRSQESLTRTRMLLTKKQENFITKYTGTTSKGNCWKIYPIYDWKTEDVWTAPKRFGWDYNTAYDVMDKAGVTPAMQRCSPAWGLEPLQKLWTYRVCFPDIWSRMCDRVPGSSTAIRYALTELYAYRTLPEKPSDMNWEEFVLMYVKKQNKDEAIIIAHRIKKEIELHYKKTSDPILYEAVHPLTGVCWKSLLALAVRRDPKGRKQPGGKVDTKNLDAMWKKYNRALDKYKQEGAESGTRF